MSNYNPKVKRPGYKEIYSSLKFDDFKPTGGFVTMTDTPRTPANPTAFQTTVPDFSNT